MQYANYTLKSTDYGNTWVRKRININNAMVIKSCLPDENNWFISGGDFLSSAIVLKSTNGGGVFVSQISNTIPDKYELFQNFPNPFNPLTKIKFDLRAGVRSQESEVRLVIYDILGKEIQILVNEKLKLGTYEVTFDGSNLPSGVYFYKLTADNYSEMKKMMLLK